MNNNTTNTNNNALAPISAENVNIESLTIEHKNTALDITANKTLLDNELNVTAVTGDKKLDVYLAKLEACQTALTVSKLRVGFILNEIKEKKDGRAVWETKFKTYREFLNYIRLNPKTADRYTATADYFTITNKDGKKDLPTFIKRGKVSESVITFAFAQKINAEIVEEIANGQDKGLHNVKDFVTAYNDYIKALPGAEDEKPSQIDTNGKPLTAEESANAVVTTPDSVEESGVTKRTFTMHGDGVKKGAHLLIPETALERQQTLFSYVNSNRAEIAEKCGYNIDTDNDITYSVTVNPNNAIITLMQTTPIIKVVTLFRKTGSFGNGVSRKTEEPETEQNEQNEQEQEQA